MLSSNGTRESCDPVTIQFESEHEAPYFGEVLAQTAQKAYVDGYRAALKAAAEICRRRRGPIETYNPNYRLWMDAEEAILRLEP